MLRHNDTYHDQTWDHLAEQVRYSGEGAQISGDARSVANSSAEMPPSNRTSSAGVFSRLQHLVCRGCRHVYLPSSSSSSSTSAAEDHSFITPISATPVAHVDVDNSISRQARRRHFCLSSSTTTPWGGLSRTSPRNHNHSRSEPAPPSPILGLGQPSTTLPESITPTTTPARLHLHLRGGDGDDGDGDGDRDREGSPPPKRSLGDDERMPSTLWWFAGGQGKPPTGKELRDRQDRMKVKLGRKGQTGQKGEHREDAAEQGAGEAAKAKAKGKGKGKEKKAVGMWSVVLDVLEGGRRGTGKRKKK
ncbi:MAG: hypothetical protein M1837_004136 [Sclerophora amabilis]|nr:MAG: hypothetical protein M1837_004136 [Sclerophora amabilis]